MTAPFLLPTNPLPIFYQLESDSNHYFIIYRLLYLKITLIFAFKIKRQTK